MSLRRKLASLFFHLPHRRLWAQIIPVVLLTVAVPATLLGFSLFHTSERAMRNTLTTDYKEFAVIAAQRIALFLQRGEDLLKSTSAMLGIVYPSPWRQETVLVELVLDQPIFMRAVSVDLNGVPWAGSQMGRPLPGRYPPDMLQAASHKTFISDLKLLEDRTPYVTMAAPIKKSGRTVGYLVGDVNLRNAWDVVDAIQLGASGRAFLVSRDGRLIAHQDKKRVLKKEDLSGERDVRAALAGETGVMETQDASGKEVISSYAPIPGTDWGFVLRQDRDEAFRFSRVMKMQFGLIIALGELLAILASIFIAHFLTRPIKTLAAKIRSVADGDLDHRIEVGRRDEIGELIRSFNDMTEKLKEARRKSRLSAIGEAAAWISHELKNSLMLLKSFVSMFAEEHEDERFADRFGRLVPPEISRWERMLNELSGLSSFNELKIAKTDVQKLLFDTLDMMAQELKEKGIGVEFARTGRAMVLAVDQERLRQVFVNLIMNAMAAMPQGGTLTVSADLVPAQDPSGPDALEVRFKDTGRGIPADQIEKIFDLFYSCRRGGAGLGLTISRRIVEQHGGSIQVKSRLGAGTTFIVRLPARSPLGVSN